MADVLEQQVALQALVDRLVAVGPPYWVRAFSADLGYERPTATAGFSPDVLERVEFYPERWVREHGPAVHAR